MARKPYTHNIAYYYGRLLFDDNKTMQARVPKVTGKANQALQVAEALPLGEWVGLGDNFNVRPIRRGMEPFRVANGVFIPSRIIYQLEVPNAAATA